MDAPAPAAKLSPWASGWIPVGVMVSWLALIISLAGFVIYQTGEGIERYDITEYYAPRGPLKAVVFRQKQGGGAETLTKVCLLPVDRTLPPRKRVDAIFVSAGEPRVTLEWADDHHLELRSADFQYVTHQVVRSGTVYIRYLGWDMEAQERRASR